MVSGAPTAIAFEVGALLAASVARFAHAVGYDRDKSFYAVVLTVVAALYPLFAVTGGGHGLVREVAFFTAFAVLAAAGFLKNLWIVAVGLVLHGFFDLVRHAI